MKRTMTRDLTSDEMKRLEEMAAREGDLEVGAGRPESPLFGTLHFVFDGPPGAVSPRFIEVETPDGKSINAGEWHARPDGLWELRVKGRVIR